MSSDNKKNNFSIIILTYNSEDFIEDCLDSLNENWPKNIKKEILVIDNNSQDRTIEKLKKYRKAKKFYLKENKGFAKGVNFGIKKSKYSKIIILNPDTRILQDTIDNLLECEKKNKSKIIGIKSRTREGRIHNTFVRFPSLSTIVFDYTNLRKLIPGDIFHKKHYYLDKRRMENKDVDAVSGCFMLVPRKVFKKTGLFDENFFMYLEDIDFCLRAKKKGFKSFFCNKAKIIHYGGGSTQNDDKVNHDAWINSRKYYCQKHFNFCQNLVLQPILFLDKILIKTILWTKKRKPQ